MAISKNPKNKQHNPRSPLLLLSMATVAIGLVWFFFSSSISMSRFWSPSASAGEMEGSSGLERKYLYWGSRIDCPGKHCDSCEGLGHQESSLRCALEEALFLKRVFVMPSRMCINPIHNKKGILHHLTNLSSHERFMECKDRTNRSSIMLPYSFLPTSAAPKLRDAAGKVKDLLDDYDSIHVRRGDKMKIRKDRFGVSRTLHPHLDRDTRPEFIQLRIAKWIPPGRTIFIASNERTPGFFSPLSARYKVMGSSDYSSILDPVIENNYQLFMVERLILAGAKTFIKTFKEYEGDLSLTDDPKKNTKNWQIPVYTR